MGIGNFGPMELFMVIVIYGLVILVIGAAVYGLVRVVRAAWRPNARERAELAELRERLDRLELERNRPHL